MISELQATVEKVVEARNPEILRYVLTHPTDCYHTQVKPKLLFVGDLMYYEGEEMDLDYWSVMHHFIRTQ